jgi:hypothetical protein
MRRSRGSIRKKKSEKVSGYYVQYAIAAAFSVGVVFICLCAVVTYLVAYARYWVGDVWRDIKENLRCLK